MMTTAMMRMIAIATSILESGFQMIVEKAIPK